nr:hypothetical protein [Bradyrhizobium diversitatis]
MKHPVTPDGRYFVVRGRLWRMANPDLAEDERGSLVKRLMAARRAVRDAKADEDPDAAVAAHRAVDEVKRALGERGPVWWTDGAPDFNRHMAKNTPYAAWYAKVLAAGLKGPRRGTPDRYRRSNRGHR